MPEVRKNSKSPEVHGGRSPRGTGYPRGGYLVMERRKSGESKLTKAPVPKGGLSVP